MPHTTINKAINVHLRKRLNAAICSSCDLNKTQTSTGLLYGMLKCSTECRQCVTDPGFLHAVAVAWLMYKVRRLVQHITVIGDCICRQILLVSRCHTRHIHYRQPLALCIN